MVSNFAGKAVTCKPSWARSRAQSHLLTYIEAVRGSPRCLGVLFGPGLRAVAASEPLRVNVFHSYFWASLHALVVQRPPSRYFHVNGCFAAPFSALINISSAWNAVKQPPELAQSPFRDSSTTSRVVQRASGGLVVIEARYVQRTGPSSKPAIQLQHPNGQDLFITLQEVLHFGPPDLCLER